MRAHGRLQSRVKEAAVGAERDRVAGFGRLEDGLRQASDWYLWGPYVSERQWGTVREDYSADGGAWDYLPHDAARSRAYRWGEDGLAGFCDVEQRLCLGLALWNGRDPILKERLFGVTGSQGNHGEDVKECWWYLDSTPTHSGAGGGEGVGWTTSVRSTGRPLCRSPGCRLPDHSVTSRPTRRVDDRVVWRQLKLARAGMDASECPNHPWAVTDVSVLWPRFQSRVPDRLGQIHDSI